MWLTDLARVKRVVDRHNRFYTGDVSDEDMAEAPRRSKDSTVTSVVRAVALIAALLLLGAVLIRGSQPAMTPEQIVQQQDYEGEQSARRIFNLYSLKQERARRDVARAENAQSEAVASAANNKAAKSQPEESEAVIVVANQPAGSNPAGSNYEKARLSRDIPAPVISKVVPRVEPVTTTAQPQSSVPRILPLYTLRGESVVLRESPAYSARQFTVIRGAQTVTLFETEGDWAQVAANDGSGRTGYVPRADLVPAEQ